MKNLLIFTIRL